MSKILKYSFLIMLLFLLLGCSTIDEADLKFELNPGVDTVEINSVFNDAGASSYAYGFKVANEVIYNDVDITTIGDYTIVYQVDYKNVVKTITRVVSVVDETPPVGVLIAGIDTIEKDSVWIDASVNVTDNSMEDVNISVLGTVNTNIAGEYIITYVLVDTSGNQSSLVRHVFVYE